MKYIIVIPARLKSSRFPAKPLVDILGKSMIQRTYEQCKKAVDDDVVYVATDSEEIKSHCEQRGLQTIMTSEDCLTGTDRVAEVASQIDADFYINVQGDEPIINPKDILTVIEMAKDNPEAIINGYAPIYDEEMWLNRSTPKVLVGEDGSLLYMSRAPIPGNKEGNFTKAWRQVCIYLYPKSALKAFEEKAEKTQIEEIEDLEILRFLEMGLKVKMVELSDESIAVDHPEDVDKVIERLNDKA